MKLIVGGVIGWVASIIVGQDTLGEIIRNISVGCFGAWLSGLLPDNWGPEFADFYILPNLIGTVIFLSIFQLRQYIRDTVNLKGQKRNN